jgi:hypothetical protein
MMDWRPADGALLHAVDLRTGQRRSFRAPPFFVFHWANAFESEDGRRAEPAPSAFPRLLEWLHLMCVVKPAGK